MSISLPTLPRRCTPDLGNHSHQRRQMAGVNGAAAASLEAVLLNAALALAEAEGWSEVRLSRVAERTGVPLPEVGQRFRDVDAIADAWFRRARLAMFDVPADELQGLPAGKRLARVIGRWLDTLAAHRRVTSEMLGAKLYPSHPHHWVPMIFDLSRLVHDFLDAARVEGRGRVRQAQEIGLTLIVLGTLCDWLRDESSGQERSKARLHRRLRCGGRMLACCGRVGGREHREPVPPSPGQNAG
jgi:AcrR family transcriptional regulator